MNLKKINTFLAFYDQRKVFLNDFKKFIAPFYMSFIISMFVSSFSNLNYSSFKYSSFCLNILLNILFLNIFLFSR